ncbi:secreted salivary gland peptide, putative [Ixodes scapularis]|uniref:Secreted salivary gland peptide, putative n=1 Tax=Ixodes scapularis TaxID=6945 RepID=B7PCT4_IXOSC|nr:secreted salivary gland peptide, putative [Ixodes scapularis]|eukprot:XP_002410251.1 secreted salivary gland peptide, putative [Ixodes scapularis]
MPDPGHTVTTKARYNPDTGKCETTSSVTGPHDCQRFETKADCRRDCEQ